MHWIYWTAFLLYSVVVVGLGFRIWRRERSGSRGFDSNQFWSAGRRLSGWAAGLSISASMMSISWSGVYGVQLFYWYGVGGAWLLIIPWLVTMLGFFLLVPLFRRLKVFSQPELLEKRFGPRARRLLAPTLIFVFTVWGGAEIYAAGITLAPFLGISLPATLFLIALVVALYSFTGGFQAVVSTDKIQFALVAGFISIMAGIGLYALTARGGLGLLWSANQLAPRANPHWPALLSPGWALIVLTLVAYLPGWLVETDIWIRLQAARDDGQARKAILLAGANSLIFVGLMPLLIGLSALLLYPPVAGEIPARLQDGALIFNALMSDFAAPWLSILLGIGLAAAAMSTVDTCANVVALSLAYDVLEPLAGARLTARRRERLARGTSVLAVALAFIYALFTNSLWDIFYLSSGLLTTTVFLPVMAAFRPGVRPAQAYGSLIFGLVGTLLFYYLEKWGWLASAQPAWLAETGLGYILWGLACSVAGFVLGRWWPQEHA
ncbi:MAG: sodium:solute symporter family protein [Calditrichaeota bacterium]|nr:MAG: sodium:solute symporter family protein [Calditrichota bacterium]